MMASGFPYSAPGRRRGYFTHCNWLSWTDLPRPQDDHETSPGKANSRSPGPSRGQSRFAALCPPGIAVSNSIIRVVLVDDHGMVREGLRVLLRNAHDISVVGEADNGIAALSVVQRVVPDIVVLDLDMPGEPGMDALRELGRLMPQVRVLILTVHLERERLLPLLEAGARGYLTKNAASRDLVETIRVVAAGEVYVRPSGPSHRLRAVRDRGRDPGPLDRRVSSGF